jgi:TRAP-type transport system periplasmic protein
MIRSFAPLAALLFAVFAASLAPTTAGAADQAAGETKPWQLSTAVGPAFALGKGAERWAKGIGESGDGAAAVKVFPGATLAQGNPAREFVALRDGAADLAVGSSLYWAIEVGELSTIGLPWLAPDAASTEALVVGAVKERLDAAIERAGCIPLAYAALPPRALATTARVVRTPEDLAGMRVRIASTPYLADLFTAFGATPQSGSYAQAERAFRDGTLDAQEGTLPMFAATRLDTLGVRHVTLWGAIAEIAVFAANRRTWEAASEAQRTRLRTSATDAARELAALAKSDHDAALAELQRRGVTVTRLTASGQRAFADAARPVYERWAAAAGGELPREARAAVNAATRR